MSAVTANKLPNEPIVIITLSGSSADLSNREQEQMNLRSILSSVAEPVFLILDLADAQLSLEDIMRGASDAFRGDNPTFKSPNIRQILHVSDNPTLELAAEGVASEVFGNVDVQIFKTLEEALAYARAEQ